MDKNNVTQTNVSTGPQAERLARWQFLYSDAFTKRKPLVDDKLKLRKDLYEGSRIKDGKVESKCLRNMCFELIESQINSSIPQPKITPTDASKQDLAHTLESFLRLEMDRLQSESTNDRVERGVLKQGTHFYEIGWDETIRRGRTKGGITVVDRPIEDVWLQPGVASFDDIEYLFVKSRESINKIKKLTGKIPPESPNFLGLVDIITCWYYNEDGYVARFAWAENTNFVIFDDNNFESRRIRVCKSCGAEVDTGDVCPVCENTTFTEKSVTDETLSEDVVKGNPTDARKPPLVLAKAGTKVPFYAIKKLPFVMRVNISQDQCIYGLSDIDMMMEDQITSNNVLTKIEQNILKGGSIVTVPEHMNFKLSNETLKVVRLPDPKWADSIRVQSIQANTQQEDLLSDRVYQFGRSAMGITDSYQGKRDPTAESGKAKEISAQQAAGRLESKRKMKDAAYADLYRIMFYFFLAYCDTGETFVRDASDGSITNASINRYEFLDGDVGDLYYDDSFLFSVDTASVLYTSREAMWRETTMNFSGGTMGNPQDPRTQMLYWKIMKELNYPLAKLCLQDVTERFLMLQEQMSAVAKSSAISKKNEQKQSTAAMKGTADKPTSAGKSDKQTAIQNAMNAELNKLMGGQSK